MTTHTHGGAHAMSDSASAYLDGLRALGANLVIASHLLALHFGVKGLFPFGSLGVAVFFLLSGFLIMQSLLNRASASTPQLPAFLADRAARILTPYVPALVLIAIVDASLIHSRHGLDGGMNSGPLAFLGNLLLLQDHSLFQLADLARIELPWRIRAYNTAEPFWTVAIEMWIYVAIGLFFFCLVKRERIARGPLVVLAALSIPVVVWNAAAGGGKSLTLIWLLGACAGLLFHRWRDTGYVNHRPIGACVALVGAAALLGRIGKIGFQPYDLQTAALLAFVMFGGLAMLIRSRPQPVLKRALSGCASYSYSLYLLHNTVLIVALEVFSIESAWLRAAVAVAAAHAVSYALYLLFERHYRHVARWLRPLVERVMLGARNADQGCELSAASSSSAMPASSRTSGSSS